MLKSLAFALPLSVIAAASLMPAAQAAQIYQPAWYQSGMMPDQYQGPHGHYSSQSDFIRSLNGTPCGIECERRADARWQWNAYRR